MLAGDAIPVAARVAHLAEYVEVAHRIGGREAVLTLTKARRTEFDPRLVALLAHPGMTDGVDGVRAWDAVMGAEPALAVVLSDDEFDAALRAIADFIDLKSPSCSGIRRRSRSSRSELERRWGCRRAICAR
jgi:hypothetical protein